MSSHHPASAADGLRLQSVVDAHASLPGALLPMLHAIQDEFGHVPDQAVPVIARSLNLSRAEVHGVITFYHHFRSHAPGRHVVQVCRAEACQAVGAVALEAHAKKCLGIDFHETTADGAVTLEAVYCLGNCAVGPSLRIDDDIVGRVTPARFDEIIAELRAEVTA
ncbi:NAD-dependent formate dehydrogenase gamma subunit [Methyloversatilis universalis FAM5]|uniref:NAD-dependent formate dehydrogenase gamma subunit n=1 Tax=Methyloversatilis universalis (strain ATCC BAA-1314 / DSM 25237 / JCM 13912 / CCUG 52030 / FAM5) TaxID=1000565 RepID=F5RE04_METUF|nr:formate dehydrogenase subunit gamma [Methyloversatilis universalis]EGK71135.1 NAD-dependent formate dehydrogenase gamma subunit [Methyloversatilis universalis FAM5]